MNLFKNSFSSLLIAGLTALVLFLFPPYSSASFLPTGNVDEAAGGEFLSLPSIDNTSSALIYNAGKEGNPFESPDFILDIENVGSETCVQSLPSFMASGQRDLVIRGESAHLFSYDGEEGDKVLLLGNDDFFSIFLKAIKGAEKSIHLSMFLFKISGYESNRANIILDAIASAAERGVAVSVLLDESDRINDSVTMENRKSAEKLRKRGVRVRFDSPKRTTHTKAAVIDSRYVFIGSHNFSHSALRYNNELSLLVDSEMLAKKTLKYIKDIE